MGATFLIFQSLIAVVFAVRQNIPDGTPIILRQAVPFYHAIIGRFNDSPLYGECDGTIISKDWIVTSATCVTTSDGKLKNGLKVAVNYVKEVFEMEIHLVAESFIHPSFARLNKTYYYKEHENVIVPVNDIALLRVQSSIPFHKKCGAVEIYDQESKTLDGATGNISGWYLLGRSPVDPKVHEIKILPQKKCQQFQKLFVPTELDTSEQICTSFRTDKYLWGSVVGAPLHVHEKLAGIASWHHRDFDEPLFYTQVAKYKEWIKEVTGI